MTRTAYFRNGKWHRTLIPDPPQVAADVTMLEAIRMIAQNTADRRQATFRWMCGRPR